MPSSLAGVDISLDASAGVKGMGSHLPYSMARVSAFKTVTQAYVSIRQHTSAYVSIRVACVSRRVAYVSIRQHTCSMARVSAFKTVTQALRRSVYLCCFTSTKVRILAHMKTRRRRSCGPQERVGYLFYEYKSTNTDTYIYTLYTHAGAAAVPRRRERATAGRV